MEAGESQSSRMMKESFQISMLAQNKLSVRKPALPLLDTTHHPKKMGRPTHRIVDVRSYKAGVGK
jgi:hypothetical protein